MKTFISFLFVIFLFSLFFCVPSTAAPVVKDSKIIFEEKCGSCHRVDKARSKKKTGTEWNSTVQRMIKNGAVLNDAETKAIVDYLTKNYGKK